jgi:hypothetical protein
MISLSAKRRVLCRSLEHRTPLISLVFESLSKERRTKMGFRFDLFMTDYFIVIYA